MLQMLVGQAPYRNIRRLKSYTCRYRDAYVLTIQFPPRPRSQLKRGGLDAKCDAISEKVDRERVTSGDDRRRGPKAAYLVVVSPVRETLALILFEARMCIEALPVVHLSCVNLRTDDELSRRTW